jgi:hypothetical protein
LLQSHVFIIFTRMKQNGICSLTKGIFRGAFFVWDDIKNTSGDVGTL